MQKYGCTIVPLHEWDASDFRFEPAEVEQLARDEHLRWIREREHAGWRQVHGATKADPIRKTTPYMIPFDDLPKEIADFDRVFVREIPTMLASAGLQIKRPPRTDPDDARTT